MAIKNIILAATLITGIFIVPSARSAPTNFPEGMDPNSSIIGPDGTNYGTLKQMFNYSINAVQQSTAGQPNGYVAIDKNKDVTLPNTLLMHAGLQFANSDGTEWTWLLPDGSGGLNLGHAMNIASGTGGTVTMNNGVIVNTNLLANVHEISLGEFNTAGGNTQISIYTGGDGRKTKTGNIYSSSGFANVPLSANWNIQGNKWAFTNMPVQFDTSSDTTGGGAFEAHEYAFKENDTYMSAFGQWGWQIMTPAHTGISIGATPVDANGNMASHPTSNGYMALNGHYFYVHDANGNLLQTFRMLPDGAQFFTKLYGITPTDSDYGTTYATTAYVKSKVAPTVVTFANLPTNPTSWQQVICTDCYVTAGKLGVEAMYNPTTKAWTGINGDAISH